MHEKFGLLSLGMASSHSMVLSSCCFLLLFFPVCSFCVSVIHHHSNMDYRIFNVRTWSFVSVRIHTGVGHTDESAQHFDSEKLSQIFLVLRMGFKPLVFGSRVDALLIEPPLHPTNRVDCSTKMATFAKLVALCATLNNREFDSKELRPVFADLGADHKKRRFPCPTKDGVRFLQIDTSTQVCPRDPQGLGARSCPAIDRLTFHQFLQAAPHDVDVLNAQKLELHVGVKALIFIALSLGFVHHGINLHTHTTTHACTHNHACMHTRTHTDRHTHKHWKTFSFNSV